MQGTTYKLRATVGQTLVGNATSGTYKLSVGFNTGNTVAQPDLQLTVAQINPVSVERGKEVSATFTLKNAGEAAAVGNLVVKAYLSVNTELDASDSELASFTVSNSLAVNATYSYPGTGQSNKILIPSATALGSYQIILKADPNELIAERNEVNNLKTLALTVAEDPGNPIDKLKPSVSTSTSATAFNQGMKVSITATDNVGVTKVFFFHRGILVPTAPDSIEVTPSGGNYSVTVEESWLDMLGVEFHTTAYDAAGNRGVSNPKGFIYKSFDALTSPVIPTLGFGGKPENYSMFSIPYTLEDNDIRVIFSEYGESDKKKWRLLRYENGKNVETLTKIERGKGYWFNGKEEKIIRTGAGVAPPNNQSTAFQLSLAKGWNQIGNPYPFNIDWSDVLAESINSSAKGKVDEITYVFNSGYSESDVLKTWGGAFVHAEEPVTLNLPVTLKNTASGRTTNRNEFLNKTIEQDTWVVQLSVQQGAVENSYGGFGMHPEANKSKDRFDRLTVPRFVHYLELNSYHDEYFDPWFSRDVVPTADSYAWSFSIESNNDDSDIVLSWDNLLMGSNDAVLLLYDLQSQVVLNMKQVNSYQIEKTTKRDLKIFFGRDEQSLVTDVTGLGQMYPNPVEDQANIPFITSGVNEHVDVSLYDMMGKRVSGMVNGYYKSGYHVESWNAILPDGRLPGGAYFYRMTVNGKQAGQPKRLIIR